MLTVCRQSGLKTCGVDGCLYDQYLVRYSHNLDLNDFNTGSVDHERCSCSYCHGLFMLLFPRIFRKTGEICCVARRVH